MTNNFDEMKVLNGPTAIRQQFKKMFDHGDDEIYAITNPKLLEDIFPELQDGTNPIRQSNGLHSRVIYTGDEDYGTTDHLHNRESKKLNFPISLDVTIFDNKILLVTQNAKGHYIESPLLAADFISLFEALWIIADIV